LGKKNQPLAVDITPNDTMGSAEAAINAREVPHLFFSIKRAPTIEMIKILSYRAIVSKQLRISKLAFGYLGDSSVRFFTETQIKNSVSHVWMTCSRPVNISGRRGVKKIIDSSPQILTDGGSPDFEKQKSTKHNSSDPHKMVKTMGAISLTPDIL
jgi:hypothetical protein